MSRKWMSGPVLALAACGSAPDNAAATGKPMAADAPLLATPAAGGNVAGHTVAAPVAAPSATRDTGDAARPAPRPADVVAFRRRRDECDHFRGEEPYDATRAAFLRAALARTCKGTDAQLAALRKRYAGNAALLRALAGYESNVEPPKDDL